MSQCYDPPCTPDAVCHLQGLIRRVVFISFGSAYGTSGLGRCGELNNVGDKEVAGHKKIEACAEEKIRALVAVAADAYQIAVFHEVLHDKSEVHNDWMQLIGQLEEHLGRSLDVEYAYQEL